MNPKFILIDIVYHDSTLPAVTYALNLMDKLPAAPVDNAAWINAAAIHVFTSMTALEKVVNHITDTRTAHLYNRAFDNVAQAFDTVDQAAKRLDVEIRLNHRPGNEEIYNTHLPIECRKITAMMERALASNDPDEKLATLLTIRETDNSVKDQIADHRRSAALPPMHIAAETPGPKGEPERIIRDSVPPHAADVALQAHRNALEATPLRRHAMPVLTVDNPTFPISLEDYAPTRIIRTFRNSYNQATMAAILPITTEYLTHDLREEVILIVYEHGANILCHTSIDPYPRTVTNSVIRSHADHMLRWADDCGHDGNTLSHTQRIRAAAMNLLELLETRPDPTGWD